MIDLIKVGFRNLSRKKLRSFLTILGIAIGSASVVLISTIGEIGKTIIGKELEGLGLDGYSITLDKNAAGQNSLGNYDLELIQNAPGIEIAAPVTVQLGKLRMRGMISDTVVWGIDNHAESIYSIKLLHGRMLQNGDIASGDRVCLIDQQTARAFYKRQNVVGKKAVLTVDGISAQYEIIGVVTSGGSILQKMISGMIPSFIYLPYTSAQELTGKTGFDQIAVKASANIRNSQSSQSLLRQLERYGNTSGYKIEDLSGQGEQLNRLMETVTWILTLIAGISLLVAGLSIMTVMMVSVNERTREIGIKKAIGATCATILVEFILEAFSISLIGSIIGCILGVSAITAGCAIFGVYPAIRLTLLLFCVVFSVALGLVFGVYPASVASRLNPVDALRQE